MLFAPKSFATISEKPFVRPKRKLIMSALRALVAPIMAMESPGRVAPTIQVSARL